MTDTAGRANEEGLPRPSKKVRRWSAGLKQFWVVMLGAACLVWGTGIVYRLTPPYEFLHDFVQEWTSTRNFYEDKPIYWDLTESIDFHFQGRYRVGMMDVNAHPPASVLVLLPFGLLDYDSAYLAWNLVSLGALVVSVLIIVKRLELSWWMLLPIATLLIASNSLAQQINQGQLNLLLMLLLVLAWTAERDKRPWLSGACVGAAAAVKLFPGYLLLYFAARRQWKALLAGVVVAVGMNALTAAIFGWATYRDYIVEVLPQVSGFRDFWSNASVAGFWSRLFDPRSGHVEPLRQSQSLALAATVASQLLITAIVAWTTWRATTRNEQDRALVLATVGMLLVSPISWDHYFLLLVLPLLLLWKLPPQSSVNRTVVILLAIALGFIYPKWIWDATIPGDGEVVVDPTSIPSVATPGQALTVLAFQFYGLCLLFLYAWLRPIEARQAAA